MHIYIVCLFLTIAFDLGLLFLSIYPGQFIISWLLQIVGLSFKFLKLWKKDHKNIEKKIYVINYLEFEEWVSKHHDIWEDVLTAGKRTSVDESGENEALYGRGKSKGSLVESVGMLRALSSSPNEEEEKKETIGGVILERRLVLLLMRF